MADAPQFVKFVRSVPGFAVLRPGTQEYLGATRRPLTREQRIAGESPFLWDDNVVPLTAEFCRVYARELREHLRCGELVEVTREEWDAHQALVAVAEEPTAPVIEEPTAPVADVKEKKRA